VHETTVEAIGYTTPDVWSHEIVTGLPGLPGVAATVKVAVAPAGEVASSV
jgi:hypothetical protein